MYAYTISFKSSTAHANADALSRLPLPFIPSDPPTPPETILLLENISDSPIMVTQICSWLRKDLIFSKVMYLILTGWPDHLTLTDTDFTSNKKIFYKNQEEVGMTKL